MKLEVLPATAVDATALRNLMQLYHYDFSEIVGLDGDDNDLDEHGLFREVYVDRHVTDPDRAAFLVRVDGRLAGFCLVANQSYFGPDPGNTHEIAEFFVVRKYRRLGVGAEVARQVFERFPGRWEVAQVPENTAAQAFWRKVIGEYTGGRYEEHVLDSERWKGPVQVFENGH